MADQGFKRKLSAILSADVKGYSRLMGDNEEATVRTIKAYRAAFIDLAQQYRGRIVDSPGDNILAEFNSVVDAVNCAVEIQRELAERNAELAESRKMAFRIGVNLGDVIEEDGRIYGDGVNIAARVESLAEPGGICISGRAYDQVENKLGLNYEDLGEHQVKNIARPIKVYKVLSYPGAAAHRVIKAKRVIRKKWLWATAATLCLLFIIVAGLYRKYIYLPAPAKIDFSREIALKLPDGPSLAVLPFDNMSQDPDQEYICDGITENIITVLSHIPKLLVIARNSTFTYKGKSIDVQQIGQDLGAQYVLEGSIQRFEDRMRITAQLIDATSGHHMWSERYDREQKDIFKLQDEIAIEIATAMQMNITEGEIAQERFKSITDFQSYFKYLKAISYFNQFTKESMTLARKEAEELIALNPEVSVFYSLLGFSFWWEIVYGSCKSNLVCLGKATEAARKALFLDSNNSDAHSVAGGLFSMRNEYDKAIAEGKMALMLNPNNVDAYAVLGYALIVSDRPEEAIKTIKKGIRLNPIPPIFYLSNLAWAYRVSKQYENAIEIFEKCVIRQLDYLPAYVGLALSYHMSGNEEKAKSAVKEILNINPDYSIEVYTKWATFKNKEERERTFEALQKEGLPE